MILSPRVAEFVYPDVAITGYAHSPAAREKRGAGERARRAVDTQSEGAVKAPVGALWFGGSSGVNGRSLQNDHLVTGRWATPGWRVPSGVCRRGKDVVTVSAQVGDKAVDESVDDRGITALHLGTDRGQRNRLHSTPNVIHSSYTATVDNHAGHELLEPGCPQNPRPLLLRRQFVRPIDEDQKKVVAHHTVRCRPREFACAPWGRLVVL